MNRHLFKTSKRRYFKNTKGFTLVELLIAMAILAILATVGLGSFKTAQLRGRDAERKSDLKQISNALELYHTDYREYPEQVTFGSELTDGKTIYLTEVPDDPGGGTYVYVVSSNSSKYQLFGYLENSEDKNINEDITVSCGPVACNFAITSANTTPLESL